MYLVTVELKHRNNEGHVVQKKTINGVFVPKDGNADKGSVILKTKDFLNAKLREQEPDINFDFGVIKVAQQLQFAIDENQQS